jgi:c-di-GMP-binding flagellar brake protein YcgR
MIKESATIETRWSVVTALQRPLYLDEHSGIVGSKRIEAILQEIIHQMVRVQVIVYGDPTRYENYLFGVDPPYRYGRLFLKCAGRTETSTSLKFGSTLEVSFVHKGRAFYFESQVIEIEGESLRISLPKSLLYYPQRDVHRVQYPLQSPVTVEFLDPWTRQEWLVRELEDIGYSGLSFRTLPQDRPPTPGTLIQRLNLYSFEHRCYSTTVKVMHVTQCCNFHGERFYRVGAVFVDNNCEFIPHKHPVLKKGECEEIVDTPGIQKCLGEVAKSNTRVQLQDEAQRRPPVSASLENVPSDPGTLISLRASQKGFSRTPFFVGEKIRVQYTMYGTQYLFYTSVCRSFLDRVIVKQPECITWMRRRRNLRCRLPEDAKRVRIHFNNPLLDSKIVRQVLDLSEGGASISLDFKRTLLFAQMRIEKAQLDLGGFKYPLPSIRIKSVKTIPSSRGRPHCRIRIRFKYLPESTRRVILATVEQQHRPFLVKSTSQMLPDIWEFFYKSGFIYPEKHAAIQKNEKEIHRTWERLHSPETTFFINLAFLQNEKILGAGAILQAFEGSWILQHLTSLKDPFVPVNKEVNLGIAEELMMNKGIRYLKIYFRSNNPWPNKNFRAFAEKHLPPKFYDLTLYRFYQRDSSPIQISDNLPKGVQVGEMQNDDQEIIRNYFVQRGKILSARSEALFGSNMDLPETSKLYRARGLRRQRKIFVARRGPRIICFAVAEDASFGVNLSGFLNTFRIFEVWNDGEVLHQVLPVLINKVLDFYSSIGYTKVKLMANETDDTLLTKWGFIRHSDYYCLTLHRESLLYYLHYIRQKYGRVECRMLRRVK